MQTLSFSLLKTPTLLKIASLRTHNLPCYYNPMAANLCCAFESPREILRLPVLGLHSDQFNRNVQGWSQASVFAFLKRPPGDLKMKDLGSIAMSDTRHTSIKPGSPHPFFHGCHRGLLHNLQGPVQNEDGGALI